MKTYRKITIIFADEEPAMAYSDEALAQTVLERCESWEIKAREIEQLHADGIDSAFVHQDKMEAHVYAHPIDIDYVTAKSYHLKTILHYS